MQERKQNTRKRKMHIIRMAVVVIPLILLLLSQTAFAQNTYVITDGDRVLVHTSSATDPAVVLTEAGLALGADDTYTTQTGIVRSEITVQRVQNVTIDYCGEILQVSTPSETVGQLLQRLDLTIGSDMNVSVPMEAEAEDGMIITVSRTAARPAHSRRGDAAAAVCVYPRRRRTAGDLPRTHHRRGTPQCPHRTARGRRTGTAVQL